MPYIAVGTGPGATRGVNPTLGPLAVIGQGGNRHFLPDKRFDLRRPPATPIGGTKIVPLSVPYGVHGLGEYMDYHYTIPAYNSGYPGAGSSKEACHCGGACDSCGGLRGLGQMEFGTATLPLVGDIDWKTILLVVGGLWAGSKILAGGRRVTSGVRAGVHGRAAPPGGSRVI